MLGVIGNFARIASRSLVSKINVTPIMLSLHPSYTSFVSRADVQVRTYSTPIDDVDYLPQKLLANPLFQRLLTDPEFVDAFSAFANVLKSKEEYADILNNASSLNPWQMIKLAQDPDFSKAVTELNEAMKKAGINPTQEEKMELLMALTKRS